MCLYINVTITNELVQYTECMFSNVYSLKQRMANETQNEAQNKYKIRWNGKRKSRERNEQQKKYSRSLMCLPKTTAILFSFSVDCINSHPHSPLIPFCTQRAFALTPGSEALEAFCTPRGLAVPPGIGPPLTIM